MAEYTKEEAVKLLQKQTVTSLKAQGFFANAWNTLTNVVRTLNVTSLWASTKVEKEVIENLWKEDKKE